MSVRNGKLTPTENRMLTLLLDGEAHPLVDLMECMMDAEGAEYGTARVHIHNLNKKLKYIKPGHLIIPIRNDGRRSERLKLYRLVRLVSKGE